eukprot:TRINITY_DN2943_c0_g1_i12.p1 TRINITY_DN2943_c0_g1~~TRINITY_DN2943_c0_g1_i12.p1  ORF type:complete len:121 (+),score=34.84 TRINITY_DN2943_c0_g1_i12:908-1270(+)
MSCCANYVFVANQVGTVSQLDCRKDFKLVRKYKGSSGTLRDIQCHPTKPLFGECGLNRYFKLFNYAENKEVCSVYLKQIQNCFAFLPEQSKVKKYLVKARLKMNKRTTKKLSLLKLFSEY